MKDEWEELYQQLKDLRVQDYKDYVKAHVEDFLEKAPNDDLLHLIGYLDSGTTIELPKYERGALEDPVKIIRETLEQYPRSLVQSLFRLEHEYGTNSNRQYSFSDSGMEPFSAAARILNYNPDGKGAYDRAVRENLTPRMLRNLIKSTNRTKAIEEVNDFISDNHYRFTADDKYDSLNSIRNAIAQFQEDDRQEADFVDFVDLLNNGDEYAVTNADGIKVGNPKRHSFKVYNYQNRRFLEPEEIDALRQKHSAEKNKPYEYSDEVKGAVANEWRLFESPEDQGRVGCKLGHCYGDTKRYGNTHKDQYRNKIRSKKSILITKGNYTGEIGLVVDADGTIERAGAAQVKGPNNTDAPHEIIIEVENIANALRGKNVNSLSREEAQGELSDICCKYIIPQHIISAVHRRF